MKKLLVSFVSAIVFSLICNGQTPMNFDLAKRIASGQPGRIDVLVKGNISEIREITLAADGIFRYSAGDIASVQIPVSAVSKLISSGSASRIEAYPQHLQPLTDTILVNDNVLGVHAGQAPLPQGYDGTGVVIGFMDTGIDFTHPDFRDSLGHSRIKFLWDQAQPVAANTPMPYNYGQEWTGIQIDSGLASAHSDVPGSGHGTHVAGIATGNANATGTYLGVAPKADIVFVAIDFSSSSATLITDAVNYIFSKAQLLNEPCVINASLGDYYGSHDGLNLEAQMIRNMINAQPGRALVAAVGNAGNIPYHTGYTVTVDTSFTFFSGSTIYIPLYADTASFRNVRFSIGADMMSPYHSFRGNIPFTDIFSHLGVLKSDTLYNNGNRIGIIQSYGDMVNRVYSMEFSIVPDSAGYNWRLMTTGNGVFDCWTFDVYGGALPSSAVMPDSIHYKFPDTDKTTVSSFQCLDEVITVGNYTNLKTYIDYNGNTVVNTATNPGYLHATSSHGPTRDGRIRPDITAPGDMTIAAVVLSMAPGLISGAPYKLALGGYHVRNGGSSHACPSVTGIAALYLQRNPLATAMQLKSDVLCGARHDVITGNLLPDNLWGYGKADGMGALTGCVSTGTAGKISADEFLVRPNPSAGDGFTIEVRKADFSLPAIILISDSQGRTLKKVKIENQSTHIESNLAPGIYFCSLQVDGAVKQTTKIVVLR